MTSTPEVLATLATILDPEMPISIVDLGIVENVQIVPLGPAADEHRVLITITPTFVGCPALDMIRDQIRRRIGELPRVADVEVRFVNDPPWTVGRISPAGRESLRQHGVTVPLTVGGAPRNIRCPYCDSPDTQLESRFGPTRCRMIYYCPACRNSFEHLKSAEA